MSLVEEDQCFEWCVGDARDPHGSPSRACEFPQTGISAGFDVTVWGGDGLPVGVVGGLVEGGFDSLEEAG
ncbi:hypothetical protein OC70_04215 [Micrococcus luteus]|nr:hypothetical protein OC70_04215 [Micrococcus luteus]OFS14462.1 hypothetical protein HMPREF3105_03255 [Micrococcus sp. HMSC31B01]